MKHFDEFLLRDMIKEYVPMKHFCAFWYISSNFDQL